MDIQIDEGQRQMMLLALAQLAQRRPGWDEALNTLALKMDNPVPGVASDGVRETMRAQLYDDFRAMVPPAGVEVHAFVARATAELESFLTRPHAQVAAAVLERLSAPAPESSPK